jgi:hypothetical protein
MSQRDDKGVEDDKLIGRVLASWEEALARRSPSLSLGLVDNRGAIESRLRTSAFLILATLLFASLWPTVFGVKLVTAPGLISILLRWLLFSIWVLNPVATVLAVNYAFEVVALVRSGPPGVISESSFAIVWLCVMAFVRFFFSFLLIGSGLVCMPAHEQQSAGVNTEACSEMDRLERGTGNGVGNAVANAQDRGSTGLPEQPPAALSPVASLKDGTSQSVPRAIGEAECVGVPDQPQGKGLAHNHGRSS